jgi:AbrB family looped-hinge helix DNA binding protein
LIFSLEKSCHRAKTRWQLLFLKIESSGKEEYREVRKMGVRDMRREAKITSKGQVTIPQAVRQALGVQPGDKLLFEEDASGVRVIPVRESSPFGKYRGIGNPGIPRGRKGINRWLRELRGE